MGFLLSAAFDIPAKLTAEIIIADTNDISNWDISDDEGIEVKMRSNWKSEFDIPAVSYTHLRAHETRHEHVCRLLLEKKKLQE